MTNTFADPEDVRAEFQKHLHEVSFAEVGDPDHAKSCAWDECKPCGAMALGFASFGGGFAPKGGWKKTPGRTRA